MDMLARKFVVLRLLPQDRRTKCLRWGGAWSHNASYHGHAFLCARLPMVPCGMAWPVTHYDVRTWAQMHVMIRPRKIEFELTRELRKAIHYSETRISDQARRRWWCGCSAACVRVRVGVRVCV